MKKAYYWIKSVVLFLFGIVLVVWGYQVNASNSDKKKVENESSPSKPEEKEQADENTIDETETGTDSVKAAPQVISAKTQTAVSEELPAKETKKSKKTKAKAAKAEKSAVKEAVSEKKEAKATKTEIESGEKAEEATGTK